MKKTPIKNQLTPMSAKGPRSNHTKTSENDLIEIDDVNELYAVYLTYEKKSKVVLQNHDFGSTWYLLSNEYENKDFLKETNSQYAIFTILYAISGLFVLKFELYTLLFTIFIIQAIRHLYQSKIVVFQLDDSIKWNIKPELTVIHNKTDLQTVYDRFGFQGIIIELSNFKGYLLQKNRFGRYSSFTKLQAKDTSSVLHNIVTVWYSHSKARTFKNNLVNIVKLSEQHLRFVEMEYNPNKTFRTPLIPENLPLYDSFVLRNNPKIHCSNCSSKLEITIPLRYEYLGSQIYYCNNCIKLNLDSYLNQNTKFPDMSAIFKLTDWYSSSHTKIKVGLFFLILINYGLWSSLIFIWFSVYLFPINEDDLSIRQILLQHVGITQSDYSELRKKFTYLPTYSELTSKKWMGYLFGVSLFLVHWLVISLRFELIYSPILFLLLLMDLTVSLAIGGGVVYRNHLNKFETPTYSE